MESSVFVKTSPLLYRTGKFRWADKLSPVHFIKPVISNKALNGIYVHCIVNFFASTYPPTTIPIDPNYLHGRSIKLVGSRDFQPFHFVKSLDLMQNKRIDVKTLITHVLPLDKLAEGYIALIGRKGLKVMIDCSRLSS